MIDTTLAGIVCARICHDLANPVGAIVNGADLIREVGAADAESELDLLDQSARRAAAILTLHRLAFGNQRDQDAAQTQSQLHGRVAAALSGPRVSLTWDASGDGAVTGTEARLTVLMVLAARAMLGMTGELVVTSSGEAALPMAVTAKGQKAAMTDQQRAWLSGAVATLPDSRQVEFALIPAALDDAKARLQFTEEDCLVTLRAERR
jgi:histidine phosphotransferase ChpT